MATKPKLKKTNEKEEKPKPKGKVGRPKGRSTVWKDIYYVEIYRLARQGIANTVIAERLGISYDTLTKWTIRNATLKKAISIARSEKASNFQASFREYVYHRLSPELKEVWEEINECEESPSALARLEATFRDDKGDKLRQHLFLYALPDSNFNASEACRKLNIPKSKLNYWIQTDRGFADIVDEMHWHKGNFFEEGLIKAVRDGDTKAILFANKTFNKNRGYSEKLEVEHKGNINHNHVIDIETLDLPLKTKIEIMEAINKQRKQLEDKNNSVDKIIDVETIVDDWEDEDEDE